MVAIQQTLIKNLAKLGFDMFDELHILWRELHVVFQQTI